MEGTEHQKIVEIIAQALKQENYLVETEKQIGKQRYDLVATRENDPKPRFVEVYVSYKPPRYKDPVKPNIKCHNCGNEWYTKSKLQFVTCPSCRLKTKNQGGEG